MSKLMEWSKAVKQRDCKCQHCGTTEDLHAHHIKPKSERPDLIFDLSNGITLCYRCHKKEHEKKRGVRIRSANPHKKTLLAKIQQLETDMAAMMAVKSGEPSTRVRMASPTVLLKKIAKLEAELTVARAYVKAARAELRLHDLL